ncbi:hypothetical protein GGR51DRAFT_532391 [Nemania sp. FL0031]|nr:hypothetical protein GGR51DRAFT_532391 [Nemania sp. FL0031]
MASDSDFNLGALTTSFSPAPNCESYVSGLIYTQTLTTNGTTTTSEHQYHTLGLNDTSLCYPPYFHVGPTFYYSPAMCPSSWYAACGTIGAGSLTETRATCCPLGYSCMDPPAETETWSTLSCISYATSEIFVTVPDNAYQEWTRVVKLLPIVNAAAINVRWQPTDFVTTSDSSSSTPASSSSSPPSTLPSTSSPPTSAPASSNTADSDTSMPPEQGISYSTRVALGVGLGVGGFALVVGAALCFLFVRRSKRRKAGGTSSDVPTVDTSTIDPNMMKPETPSEVWSPHQPELQTSDNTHEMGTASNIHEINTPTPAVYPSHNAPWSSAQPYQNWARNELAAD